MTGDMNTHGATATESRMLREMLSPGTVIFQEGEAGDRAYVVERGTIEISSLREGNKIVLAHLGSGQIFGEMALIDDELRSATATVLDEAELIVVRRDQIMKRLEQADTIVQLLMKTLIARFRTAQRGLLSQISAQGGTTASVAAGPTREEENELSRAFQDFKHEHEIQEAIERREFVPFFQPIVVLQTGRLAGFESLVRWRHPERGYISPMEFVDLAENTGLIRSIDLLVLREAWRQLNEALGPDQQGAEHLFISSNLSGHHFSDETIIQEMQEFLQETGIRPERMKLEITESVLISNPDAALDVLRRLKDLGVTISLDDFGTGYSSLSYLHRFPIDTLKIDRSFVSQLDQSARSLDIVKTVMSLAKTMRLAVVGEGVENHGLSEQLLDLGCDYGQGYHFGKPMDDQAMGVVVADWQAGGVFD